MGDHFAIKHEGYEEVEALLNKVYEAAGSQAFLRGLIDAAAILEEHISIALDRMVYDTPESPNYQRTIDLKNKTLSSGRTQRKGSRYASSVISDVPYAGYVHFGTEKADGSTLMKARPFHTEGGQSALSDILDTLRESLQVTP